MNEEREDFVAKLLSIEEQARICAEELPAGAIRQRIEDMGTIAKLLRMRLDVASPLILPEKKSKAGL